jgi:hypothetical protein
MALNASSKLRPKVIALQKRGASKDTAQCGLGIVAGPKVFLPEQGATERWRFCFEIRSVALAHKK